MESFSFPEAIKSLTDNSKYFISFANHIAHLNRAYYESLVKQGFSNEEAFELVVCHGLNLVGKAGGRE